MNRTLALGFAAGMLVAFAVSYVATHRETVPVMAPAPVPAPAPPAKPEIVPDAPKPVALRIAKPKVLPSVPGPSEPAGVVPVTPVVSAPMPEPPAVQPETHLDLPPSPPPARLPNIVTIPPGTAVAVRLSEGLSSGRNRAGDEFAGTLDRPLVVDGFVLAERGARVEGHVTESVMAGRVRGLAQLSVELTKIHISDGQNVPVHTHAFVKQGPESKGEDAAKVGIGAALGAIIGAAAGGGKGAAIGAAAGGAAGGGAVAATRGKPAVLAVETVVTFRIEEPLTLTERLP